MPLPMDDFDEAQLFTPPSDPLEKYYRTKMPGVHVRLPTNGVFMPPGSIEFTMTGDIPVYPMGGADELLLKSPDALMSGFAIEELLRSCVPAIKAPRLVSSPDLDVLLLGIRAATYGEVMKFGAKCPACGAENESHRNLPYLLTTMTTVDKENPVRLNDEVVVYLKPYNLMTSTKLGLASFEEARKLQALQIDETLSDEEKSEQVKSSMTRIKGLTIESMADCVIKVVVPEGTVADPLSIRRFIHNMAKPWLDAIEEKLKDMNNRGIDKHYDVQCASCEHTWKAQIEFNPSTFFATGS